MQLTEIEDERQTAEVEHIAARVVPIVGDDNGQRAGIHGTGILCRLDDRLALVTARHVIDPWRVNLGLVGVPLVDDNGMAVRVFSADEVRFSVHADRALDLGVVVFEGVNLQSELARSYVPVDPGAGLGDQAPSDHYVVSEFPDAISTFGGIGLGAKVVYALSTALPEAPYVPVADAPAAAENLFLKHTRNAVSATGEGAGDLPLHGMSGGPIWCFDRSEPDGLWTSNHGVRLAEIQTAYRPDAYIRCARWSAVRMFLSTIR